MSDKLNIGHVLAALGPIAARFQVEGYAASEEAIRDAGEVIIDLQAQVAVLRAEKDELVGQLASPDTGEPTCRCCGGSGLVDAPPQPEPHPDDCGRVVPCPDCDGGGNG